MFFKKSEEHHRKRGASLPFILLRMCLSLIMLSIFGLVVFQAFRHFSGVDPLKTDPKAAIYSMVTSEEGAKLVKDLLSLKFPSSLSDIKDFIKSPSVSQLTNSSDSAIKPPVTEHSGPVLMRFAIVTDTHNDNSNLQKALSQAKSAGSKFVIGLGDYTDTGTTGELKQAKNQFDASGLPFYSTIGDHDMWDCRNRKEVATCNFTPIFGSNYQSFEVNGIRFLLIDDADNYLGMDQLEIHWLEDELSRISAGHPKQVFALMQEPIYHPTSDHYMGKVTPSLLPQAQKIADLLKGAGVAEVFAGDTHFFTQYSDPRTGLKMTTVGAVTEARNAQHPRFALVDVYEDGSYNIADTEIKP